MSPAHSFEDPTVAVEVSDAALAELRAALEAAHLPGVVRYVVLRTVLPIPGRDVRDLETLEAIIDTGGNLVALSMTDRFGALPGGLERCARATTRIDDEIAAGRSGCELPAVREIILDADGGSEVRIACGLDLEPDGSAEPGEGSGADSGAGSGAESGAAPIPDPVTDSGRHLALHDATFHLHHRAPDLDALRDRLADARLTRRERLLRRVRRALRMDS